MSTEGDNTMEPADFHAVELPPRWKQFVMPRRDRVSRSYRYKGGDPTAAIQRITDTLQNQAAEYDTAVNTCLESAVAEYAHQPVKTLMADASDNPLAIQAVTFQYEFASRRPAEDVQAKIDDLGQIASAWIDSAGLSGALRGVEEIHWWDSPRGGLDTIQLGRMDSPAEGFNHRALTAAKQLRVAVAQADGDVWAAARSTAAELRLLSPSSNARMAFLFPSELTWVDDALEVFLSGHRYEAPMTLCSLSTRDQFGEFASGLITVPVSGMGKGWIPLATALDGGGADSIAALGPMLSGLAPDIKGTRAVLQAVTAIETDEALAALANAFDKKEVMSTLIAVATGRPDSAIRVLLPLSTRPARCAEATEGLLTSLILEHPQMATSIAADLGEADRAAVAAITEHTTERPTATDAQMPSFLQRPPWDGTDATATPRRDEFESLSTDWPPFVSPTMLTMPLLADGVHELSLDASRNLMGMLSISTFDGAHPSLAETLPSLDRRSVANFAWEIFQAWGSAQFPKQPSWIFRSLGAVGDNDTVRELVPLIRAWPSKGHATRAQGALGALQAIGTDFSLMKLAELSRTIKTKGTKRTATLFLKHAAEARGLTVDELTAQLVPDLGLDSTGSLRLDYGPRSFHVSFDEALKPVLVDESAKVLKTLPKPNQQDDQTLAAQAKAQFTTLKKDAKAVASNQIFRLEQAMTNQTRWSRSDFQNQWVEHPLLRHLSGRLVWATFDDAAVQQSFRIAEDGTFADADDAAVALDTEGSIGLAHPLHLEDPELARWSEVLSDYELLQPFDQVGRHVFTIAPGQSVEASLGRFVGPQAPFGNYLRLEHRGWSRSSARGSGISDLLLFAACNDRSLVIELEHGITDYDVRSTPDQAIRQVRVTNDQGQPANFAELSDITISELIRDLTAVFA